MLSSWELDDANDARPPNLVVGATKARAKRLAKNAMVMTLPILLLLVQLILLESISTQLVLQYCRQLWEDNRRVE